MTIQAVRRKNIDRRLTARAPRTRKPLVICRVNSMTHKINLSSLLKTTSDSFVCKNSHFKKCRARFSICRIKSEASRPNSHHTRLRKPGSCKSTVYSHKLWRTPIQILWLCLLSMTNRRLQALKTKKIKVQHSNRSRSVRKIIRRWFVPLLQPRVQRVQIVISSISRTSHWDSRRISSWEIRVWSTMRNLKTSMIRSCISSSLSSLLSEWVTWNSERTLLPLISATLTRAKSQPRSSAKRDTKGATPTSPRTLTEVAAQSRSLKESSTESATRS